MLHFVLFILILYNNINVSQIKQLNTAFTQCLCNIVGLINRSLTTLHYLNIHTQEKLIDSEHHSFRLNRTGFNTINYYYNKKIIYREFVYCNSKCMKHIFDLNKLLMFMSNILSLVKAKRTTRVSQE